MFILHGHSAIWDLPGALAFFLALGNAQDLGSGPIAQGLGSTRGGHSCVGLSVNPPPHPFSWPWDRNQGAWAVGPIPFLACFFFHLLGLIIPALLWCLEGGWGIMQGISEKMDREELHKGQVPPWDQM